MFSCTLSMKTSGTNLVCWFYVKPCMRLQSNTHLQSTKTSANANTSTTGRRTLAIVICGSDDDDQSLAVRYKVQATCMSEDCAIPNCWYLHEHEHGLNIQTFVTGLLLTMTSFSMFAKDIGLFQQNAMPVVVSKVSVLQTGLRTVEVECEAALPQHLSVTQTLQQPLAQLMAKGGQYRHIAKPVRVVLRGLLCCSLFT